ncbi:MAG: hypothetical protein JETCAE02_27660 [Anaerolineaceae bacterium]|jgi:hypothetical protein|nr:hypothetical protein [Anaerolineae bacterium]MBL1172851.1 hypothetical protein [Chloroflexota bacterium]MDL1927201.1 hypothetical protein [Anaerolineae bacterium AMX1]MDX9936596.1 hypothetical protein [Anaerolineales bacterium]GER78218.1 conserved hypothetical protein [Candidatus Denitrolinea symbiosum]GJQ40354.1 MAG: hypothetical protein JETCAE02_27660 [Anaerolineaceae bacterium]
MKIIDQTPLLDANGQLSLVNRLQGMWKYGFSWPTSLQAQQIVIAQLNKMIEKGYTLFRNQQLGASEIVLPLILVGPAGVYVLEATLLKGFYQARGDEWGTLTNEVFQPASVNLVQRAARMAKILEVFFQRQGAKLAAPIEPVLVSANPGMQVDSVRPIVRVVRSDAIDRFAAGLLTAPPIYTVTQVSDLVDRIQSPRSRQSAAQPEPQEESPREKTPFPEVEASRMQSILNSPQSDALIEKANAADLDFAFEEEPSPTVLVRGPGEPSQPERPAAKPARRRVLGMTVVQLLILAGIFLCWLAVMAAGFYLIILPQL